MLERRPKRKSLNDVIPNWLTGQGIMSSLTVKYDVPWKEAYQGTEIALDIAYQGSHSGHKTIAPFLEYFLDPQKDDDVLTSEEVDKVAMALWATYRRKWDKLWELYMKDYDPLTNYDMQTDTTEAIQSTGEKTGTVSVTGTETLNNTDTTRKTGTISEDETENVSGRDTTTDTGNQTNTKTLNTQKESDEDTTYGKTENRSKTGDETHTGKDTENDHYITNDVSEGVDTNQIWGFNSTVGVNSDATNSKSQGDRVHDETKIQSSKKVIDYAIAEVNRMSGTDTVERVEAETGTITDRRDDNLSSIKAQSSITTVSSVLTNNLTDETSHTGTIGNTSTTTNDLKDEDNADRTLDEHKYGNIGVSSIQRMFKEEVENWTWNFINSVFDDIDAMLVLAVH